MISDIMSHSQFHCIFNLYLDMHGLVFETSVHYWQGQPGNQCFLISQKKSPPLLKQPVFPPFVRFLLEGVVYFGSIKFLVWGAVSAARLKNLNSLQRDPPRKRRQAGMGPKSKGQLGNEDLQSPTTLWIFNQVRLKHTFKHQSLIQTYCGEQVRYPMTE